MDAPIIVNIILCILSFVLAAISVITVVITLRQNHKMIENSTRPYIVVYSAVTNFQSPYFYLCVKNFGQSGAHITKFECNHDLREYSYDDRCIPFKHLPGSFVAPRQSFVCNLDTSKLFQQPISFTFTVEYIFDNKKYMDTFTLNPQANSDLIQLRADTKGQELHAISYALQDIGEKLL